MKKHNYLTIILISGLLILNIFVLGAAAAPVAEAETTLTTQTQWGWYYGQTADQINAAKASGSRPIELVPNGEIESVPHYNVVYVKNDGSYKVGDWQVVIRTLDNAAQLPGAAFRSAGWRITNVAVHEIKDTVNGKPVNAKRAATIMVKDNAYLPYDVRVWLNFNELKDLGSKYRVVDLDTFETGGTAYYSAVIVPNTGENNKNWAWLFNSTKSAIETTAKSLNGKKFRVTDIERRENGNYDALMVESKGEVEKWYTNQTDATLKNDVLRRHGTYYGGPFNGGIRFFDLVAYKDGGTTKYEVLTMENGSGKYVATGDNVPGMEGIEAAFMKTMSRYGIPGATFALSKNGKVVYRRAFGMADLDSGAPATVSTRGRIASISKTITAAAIMKLYEEGKIDLDNKVFGPGGYLSSMTPFDYTGYKGNTVPNLAEIKVRHLLNHTAGWDRGNSGDPNAAPNAVCNGGSECEPTINILPKILAHAKKQGTVNDLATQLASIDDIIRYMIKPDDKDFLPVYKPGTKFAYSNFGFTVLQKIVEVRSGKPYADYIKAMGASMGVQFIQGASNPNLKAQFEWTYHATPGSDGTTGVAWSSVALPQPVGDAYYYDMRMLLGHGGWVVSPDDLLTFVSKLDGTAPNPWLKKATFMKMMERPDYVTKKDAAYYGFCWRVEPLGTDTDEQFVFEHGGSLTGASSLMLKGWNHRKVAMSFLFNYKANEAENEIKNAIEPIIASKDDDGTLAKLAK